MPKPQKVVHISPKLRIEYYQQHANIIYQGEAVAKFTSNREQQGYVALNEWGIIHRWNRKKALK